MTRDELVGSVIQCPGCGGIATVVKIIHDIEARDGSAGCKVQLDDGFIANFWLKGPKSEGPPHPAQRN